MTDYSKQSQSCLGYNRSVDLNTIVKNIYIWADVDWYWPRVAMGILPHSLAFLLQNRLFVFGFPSPALSPSRTTPWCTAWCGIAVNFITCQKGKGVTIACGTQ